MEIETTKLVGIPNAEVPDTIAQLQASPRYLRHVTIPEGKGKTTIVVVYSVPEE